ncbi:FGGY family carbohydrate kinase [Lactobacillus sp. R2/2]|nr:FGGY family carbohydrate kinase [Lactobacillus sp. R2/2]
MPEKYILTIDQSTQATKLILFDQHMKLVWKADLPHKQIINDQGWISHDLNEIKNNLSVLFKMVLKE